MANQIPPLDDDETLILRILDQDAAGLERLLILYGPKAKGYLKKHYGGVLSDIDLDAAIYQAADRVWRYAQSFDPNEGSLKSWFMRIVQTQALDIIEQNSKHSGAEFDLEQHDVEEYDEPLDAKTKQQIEDLDYVIENKLTGLQQAIIRADLKSGDVASVEWLARVHHTSRNSISVSRTKARQNIKKYMTELENQRRSQGGKHELRR